ncbi:dorsal-ventral patterning tolloid-like protein 1 [Glandiceps talaboti]
MVYTIYKIESVDKSTHDVSVGVAYMIERYDDGDEGGENNECGGTHLLSSENSIEISSPNYPEDYSNYQDCTWIVTNTDGGNIRLLFSNLVTESSYDYVQFGSGNIPDTNAAKYSGIVIPDVFTTSGDTAWIVFHSDGSNTNSGFVLTATAVGDDDGGDEGGENNECGETHLLSSENYVVISSPNYPEEYSNNQDCTWIVTNTDGGNIQLIFSNLVTESSYDYVQFGSGNIPDTNAAKYSGSVIPDVFTTSSDTGWIVFHSDGSNTNFGFLLTATAVGGDEGGDEGGENNECGETHLLSSGNSVEISSPNYPEGYSNNQDCTWIVTNTVGGNIQLSFSNFITESSYDYVQFGNGNTPDTNAEKYSGEVVPANFISSSDSAWLVFHSDGSNTWSGFVLTATAVEDCGGTVYISTGEIMNIESPNYPRHYDNNLDCTWIIINPVGDNILFNFTNMDTELGYDYVQFGSGSTPIKNQDTRKYWGSILPVVFETTGSDAWLTFHSDGSRTGRGFRLMLSAIGDRTTPGNDEDDNLAGPQWRKDLRCGPEFPLPDGSPAKCDPDGEHHCCSHDGKSVIIDTDPSEKRDCIRLELTIYYSAGRIA